MSGGEKQLLAFASVYAGDPEIYVLDEPSSNLDSYAMERLRNQIRLIRSQGKTIVIAEHRFSYVADFIDYAALAFALALALLLFDFAFRAYSLTWETTILSSHAFAAFVQASGWLPARLGFAVPDAAAVQQALAASAPASATLASSAAAANQSAWALWLI